MKMVHESVYPGLNTRRFRRLFADNAYQEDLATHGKVTRHNIHVTRVSGSVRTTWVARLHRALDRGALRPLQPLLSNGITVEWDETHAYSGLGGHMQLAVRAPSKVKTVFDGDATFFQRGDTLVRRIEVDLDKAKLPLLLRFIPGMKSLLAGEVERGLTRADKCTVKWLSDHPDRYKSVPKGSVPDPNNVLDTSSGSH